LCLARCVEPIDAPSAFSSEHYLCDEEHAAEFDAQVERCRQDHLRDQSCAGVLSLRGVFDSQPVVLDERVVKATYSDQVQQNGPTIRVMTINAIAPYFRVRFDSNFSVPPEATKSGPVPDTDCSLGGGLSCGSTQILNLEARGGNYLSGLVSAVREIKLETLEEVRVKLSGGLARGGNIDACFHIFPQRFF
jgi:hypothetical protein